MRIDLSVFNKINQDDKIFIEWFKPKDNDASNAKRFVNQMSLIESTLNLGKKVCIWDIDRSITYEEMKWFISKDVRLFEPYLMSRAGFEFLPDPIIVQDVELDKFTQNRDIAYGYYDTLNDKQYSVDLYNINPTILNSYENVKLAIAFDTKANYEAGYLNPKLFKMMYEGALVVLPDVHKFFHSLFSGQIIRSGLPPKDLSWLLKVAGGASYGCAVDVTEKLKNEWNILTEDYFLDVLNGI